MINHPNQNSPVPSIQRLPSYLRLLKKAKVAGEDVISCTRIAEEFGQLSVQVRKDLAMTGVSGRPKVGYQVSHLIDAIEQFLGWDKKMTACLVGAGSLGSAILKYDGFLEHGLQIIAAFDADPVKVGQDLHHCPILAMSMLFDFTQGKAIDIGIITVPATSAQTVADALVQVGVKGIWNYSPRKLDLPPEIICEDVKLSSSFAVLTNRLLKVATIK